MIGQGGKKRSPAAGHLAFTRAGRRSVDGQGLLSTDGLLDRTK